MKILQKDGCSGCEWYGAYDYQNAWTELVHWSGYAVKTTIGPAGNLSCVARRPFCRFAHSTVYRPMNTAL
jgi:hypothetical protein